MQRHHVLEEVVRAWVEEALPGQTTVADQAVELVTMSCQSGASIPVACAQVSKFVNCRVQHPAYQRVDSHAMALLAS